MWITTLFLVSIVNLGIPFQFRGPTPPPVFVLTAIVDDTDILVEKGAGGLEVLVQIQNVSSSDQVLPILEGWTRRIDVVDSSSSRSQRTTGSCSAGRDPNASWLLRPGESADTYCVLPVGNLLNDSAAHSVRVRYKCARIENLSLIAECALASATGTAALTEHRVVETPAIELLSAPLMIKRISSESRQRQEELRESTRRIESGVWNRCWTGGPSSPTGEPAPVKPRVRIEPKDVIRELDALGRSPWADDALFSMAIAARSGGDEAAAHVFLAEVCTRYPSSTGCARANVLAAGGALVPLRSRGSF